MLADYHIGTLDEASLAALEAGEAEPADAAPRATFLRPKAWTRAILSAKKPVSPDTKIFTFDLEHAGQAAGLPVGQHLLMRLRDPVTREAIIRAYTPISDSAATRGTLDVLVKIYRGSGPAGEGGGRMTQALDAIPLGHFVDFRGPVGKFEYLGGGMCSLSSPAGGVGRRRKVRRFVMVCAGSGVTPIYQVLRAVLGDATAPPTTRCLVLDGNRAEPDILLRRELDALAAAHPDRCRLLHALSRPPDAWAGIKGRMDRALFDAEVGPPPPQNSDDGDGEGGDLVLVCGPEALEQSVRREFKDIGWSEEDLVFF